MISIHQEAFSLFYTIFSDPFIVGLFFGCLFLLVVTRIYQKARCLLDTVNNYAFSHLMTLEALRNQVQMLRFQPQCQPPTICNPVEYYNGLECRQFRNAMEAPLVVPPTPESMKVVPPKEEGVNCKGLFVIAPKEEGVTWKDLLVKTALPFATTLLLAYAHKKLEATSIQPLQGSCHNRCKNSQGSRIHQHKVNRSHPPFAPVSAKERPKGRPRDIKGLSTTERKNERKCDDENPSPCIRIQMYEGQPESRREIKIDQTFECCNNFAPRANEPTYESLEKDVNVVNTENQTLNYFNNEQKKKSNPIPIPSPFTREETIYETACYFPCSD
jgi:hypothetical protein